MRHPGLHFVFRRVWLGARRLFAPPTLPPGPIRLNLGCGLVVIPGFVNIDQDPLPHVHYVRAVDDLAPFADGSVELVYASHCLEHFSHLETGRVLAEWHRVLRPGGMLRVSVPDFDRLVDVYLAAERSLHPILGLLMGGQQHRFNFHYTAFNRCSLSALLLRAGFRDVADWVPGDAALTTLEDTASGVVSVGGTTYRYSLNLEATKDA